MADSPVLFTLSRKIIELNFVKEKRLLRSILDLESPKITLDIGCGTGEFAPLFARHDYTGIDISPRYIEYAAARRPKGKFRVMDATNLEFADNSFDCVLIMGVLHHLGDDEVEKVLAEAKRVTRPGGTISITEDAHIDDLKNWFVRLVQKFDKGDGIRTPAEYMKIFGRLFRVTGQRQFRSGGSIYFSVVATK